jgi:hypothetical protein
MWRLEFLNDHVDLMCDLLYHRKEVVQTFRLTGRRTIFSDVRIALECMEVFWVAFTCFNLNFEFFVVTCPNKQQRCLSILRY